MFDHKRRLLSVYAGARGPYTGFKFGFTCYARSVLDSSCSDVIKRLLYIVETSELYTTHALGKIQGFMTS